MSIKFLYFYRDGANYKNFNEVFFSNPLNLPIEKIEEVIQKNLIDGQWFYANKWNLPDLHFKAYAWDSDIDHDWHEFEAVEQTQESATENLSIEDFLSRLSQ